MTTIRLNSKPPGLWHGVLAAAIQLHGTLTLYMFYFSPTTTCAGLVFSLSTVISKPNPPPPNAARQVAPFTVDVLDSADCRH